jgi:hypothetical protein
MIEWVTLVTHAHTHVHSLSLTRALSLSLSHTHTHTHSHVLALFREGHNAHTCGPSCAMRVNCTVCDSANGCDANGSSSVARWFLNRQVPYRYFTRAVSILLCGLFTCGYTKFHSG